MTLSVNEVLKEGFIVTHFNQSTTLLSLECINNININDNIIPPFQVKDPDNKNRLTQTHTCSLLNSHNGDEDVFYITQTHQRNLLGVKANKILDFETKKFYNITVRCDDSNLGITKSFLIEITGKCQPI